MLAAAAAAALASAAAAAPPATVPEVDLERYAGRWYQIALIPNRFQAQCDRNTTATYALRADGRIAVTNRCQQADGSWDEAQGVARVVDPVSRARLEVSFVRFLGLQLFWGDYWVIGLDPEYRWAVVGTPTRRYGWILARTPELEQGEMAVIGALLREQGYDPSAFAPSPHSDEGEPDDGT